MKTKYFIFATLLLAGIGFGACTKSSTNPTVANTTFVATINGASETPANASAATGTATFIYNPTTYVLSGTVTLYRYRRNSCTYPSRSSRSRRRSHLPIGERNA